MFLQKLKSLAFDNFPNLKEIYISNGVINIEEYTFGG